MRYHTYDDPEVRANFISTTTSTLGNIDFSHISADFVCENKQSRTPRPPSVFVANKMKKASPEIYDLARRLLMIEATPSDPADGQDEVARRVIQELRLQLIRFAGVEGFRSLLSRALTLARTETASLDLVQIRADGSLENFGQAEHLSNTGTVEQPGTVLLVHLLQLLVTFIGESLTLTLVSDKWPEAVSGAGLETEGKQ